MDRKTIREKERLKKGAIMKSRMNKLMSLCLVAMMGSTLISQPIHAEEVGEFEEESFEEATVEFEEATFEEEKQNVEASQENSVTADFEYEGLKYKITDENKKEVEVIGLANDFDPSTGYTLDIPDVVQKQDESYEEYAVTSIGDNAFKDCPYTSIKIIELPRNLRAIGESAFAGFTSVMTIRSYSLDHLTTIGKSAFKGCTSLEGIGFPTSLTTIGESAFEGCTSLGGIGFDYDRYEGASTIQLKTIGKAAFKGCTSLRTVRFHDHEDDDQGALKLETIGESAFEGCKELKDIEFPKGLKEIGNNAFKDCIDINLIDLPEGLTTIGDSAFSLGKPALHEKSARLLYITIPSTVNKLGSIFGDESPFELESSLIFLGDQYPIMDQKFLDVISKGVYKPIIYFPNNEAAMKAYAGKNSPFVQKGLINLEHFNSYYESFQFCPKGQIYIVRMGNFPEKSLVEVTSGDTSVAFFPDNNDFYSYWVANNGLNDQANNKTILGFDMVIHGKKFTSEANKIQFIVDHDYVWQITSFPDFFKSGSMYQKCEGSCGKKNEPIRIPSYLKLLEGLIDLDDFDFDDFDDLPSIIMGINEDQEFKSNSTYEVKNESVELIPFPLKDSDMDFEQYECSVESSNPSVATAKIDEQGKVVVTTVGKGQAKITTTYTKKEDAPEVVNESGFINEADSNEELEGTFVVDVVESEDDIPSEGGSTGGGSIGGSTSGGSGGSGGGSTVDPNAPTQQVENAVYRAYNPNNGEHLYTTNYGEFKVITKNGWDDEGIAFMSESKEKGQAVYRVYNPNNGLHHYTIDVNEKNTLVSLGWNDEGVEFYTSKNPKDTPVYRVYNENDGNHHYTINANEALALISMGWKNEGIAFLTAPLKS